MTTILQVQASARTVRSLSRELTRTFSERWLAMEPEAELIERDVGTRPPPFVSEDWIAAAFTPLEDRTAAQREVLAASDEMIGEVTRSDVIVIATPMYNYGMPAALKAWFDQVIRVNETFSFDLARGDWPLEPVLSGKQLVVLASFGEFGFEAGGIREAFNHLQPHIVTCSRYLGVDRDHFVGIEYQEFGDSRHERSRTRAHRQARDLVDTMAPVSPAARAS